MTTQPHNMKEFIVTLINKDDNKNFQISFWANNLDEAWNDVAGYCQKLNSECVMLIVK